MNYKALKESIPAAGPLFKELYGEMDPAAHEARYLELADGFREAFGSKEFELFTSAGRTEILGNHTDHNRGLVAAGSVHLDCIAAAAPNSLEEIRIISKTFRQDFRISLKDLAPPRRRSGTVALIKGVFAGLLRQSAPAGGLDIFTTSNIPGGAGLSSSASFEMLLCTINDFFYGGNRNDILSFALAGQYAENQYWNKGSGLLDQIACAAGGIISIDFSGETGPRVKQIPFLPEDIGLDLVIVNTGRGHSDLSREYSSIPAEMREVAAYFGKKDLSEVSLSELLGHAAALRSRCSDRAILRALHFFEENRRVAELLKAMQEKDQDAFCCLIRESGNSSWKWLQNCQIPDSPLRQDLAAALAFTEIFLEDRGGACRVHGGGFAGTIAVYLPIQYTDDYIRYIERILGEGNAYKIHLRRQGACRIDLTGGRL